MLSGNMCRKFKEVKLMSSKISIFREADLGHALAMHLRNKYSRVTVVALCQLVGPECRVNVHCPRLSMRVK